MAIEKQDTRSVRRRIKTLADAFDLDHVAELMGMDLEKVEAIVCRSQERLKIAPVVVNLKTREVIRISTWRAGYFKVCMLGWTDWQFGIYRR